MPRDSAAADRPASYLVGTAAAFPLFFRDRTKPINQLPFSPSAKFPKSGSSCESRATTAVRERRVEMMVGNIGLNMRARGQWRVVDDLPPGVIGFEPLVDPFEP